MTESDILEVAILGAQVPEKEMLTLYFGTLVLT